AAADIAHGEPSVILQHRGGSLRIIPVAEHHVGAADMDLARFTVRNGSPTGITKFQLGRDRGTAGGGRVSDEIRSPDGRDGRDALGACVTHAEPVGRAREGLAQGLLYGRTDRRSADSDVQQAAGVVAIAIRQRTYASGGAA